MSIPPVALAYLTIPAENSDAYLELAQSLVNIAQRGIGPLSIAFYTEDSFILKLAVPDRAIEERLKQEIETLTAERDELKRRLGNLPPSDQPLQPLYRATVIKTVNIRDENGALTGSTLLPDVTIDVWQEVNKIGDYSARVVIDPPNTPHPRNIWWMNIKRIETGGGGSNRTEFFWPTEFHVVTQRYGEHPNEFGYGPSGHEGIDLRAPEGSKLFACLAGEVTFSGWKGVYGNMVRIKSVSGGENVVIEYCHLSKIDTPIFVVRGGPIGLAGQTGNTRGPHLHLNLFINGVRINPASYLGV